MIALVFYQEVHITSILHYHDSGVYTTLPLGPIVPGKSVAGEFVARENNLGTVKLKVNTFHRMNTTDIQFTLRQKGNSEWLVVNTYDLDRFNNYLLYPFGFPPMVDSAGKTYEFEITSINGTGDNAIGLFDEYHSVATLYAYSKTTIPWDKKIKSFLSDPYFWAYIAMFVLPILGFVLKSKRHAIVLAFVTMLLFITLPVHMHSHAAVYVAFWVSLLCVLTKSGSRGIYACALGVLFVIPLAVLAGNTLVAEKSATLVFYLLVTGVMIAIYELVPRFR